MLPRIKKYTGGLSQIFTTSSATGKLVYQQVERFVGIDSFSFRVTDEKGLSSNIAKVSLKIPTSDIKESKSFPVKQDTISISNNQNISKQVPSKHLSINGGKVITRHSVNNETAQIESTNKVINHIPVANAGKDQSIFEDTNHVMLKGTGRDPDHDTISYSWEQVTGDPVILRDANNPTMTFNAPAVVGEKTPNF